MDPVFASMGNPRPFPGGSSQHQGRAGNIPRNLAAIGGPFNHNKSQSSISNENEFKKPFLDLPSVPLMKRKLSRTELDSKNKVHLRRQSNGFDSSSNNNRGSKGGQQNETPLSDKTLSSLNHDINTADVPALILAPFEPPPWLEFGKAVVGTKKMAAMIVQNPTDLIEKLTVDSSCKMEEKGFNIVQLDPLQQTGGRNTTVEPLVLPPRSKAEISICWTPLTAGNVRASAILKTNTGRFMINLRGCGDVPIPEYQSLNSSRRPSTASIRGVKQGSLATLKPRSSVLKQSMMRHSVTRPDTANRAPVPGGYNTLPYVTTNEMYDEKWIDKQQQSFKEWLNHEFSGTVDDFSSDDPSSWSYYSHKLEYEHTRAAACKIYQSDTFRIVLRKVEESIARDRLQLHPERNLVGDITTRREIIDMLFSFDIRWLVLGLETITGKEVAIKPNFDRATISGFINQAIFHNEQIEAEFEPDRILSNRPKFYQAMNRLVLKRIFMLILFLDKAKLARLISSDPCLFNKESDVKSCRTLLLKISNSYLLGEGDIIRHLLFMGFSVLHTQAPLDEFKFKVENLAVDLRDGVRLCRLIDLHCPELNLCQKMKFPTLSKAHMQQNVSLALNTLVKQGISLEGTRGGVVSSRDIVEGHREKTFGLLWKLILNWKVAVLLDLGVLEAEISALRKEYMRLFGVDQPDRVDTVYFTSDQLSALLRWCQAIGSFYNLSINNFTTSFSDGRAFGALLSYYHPTLLDMDEMKDSAQFLAEYKQGLHQPEPQLPERNDGKGWFIDAKNLKDPITQAKEMDRFNYRLLDKRVQALGGVPITLRHKDMSNVGVPDEKAVILFVTYLCARLMHLNNDIRAAKTIQRIWRKKHYGRKEENRINSTIVIQKFVRKFLSRKRLHGLKKQRDDAAVLIQTGCRMFLARTRALHKLESVIKVQSVLRGYLTKKHYVEIQWAALTVQRYYRGHIVRLYFNEALVQHRAVQMVQAQARGYLTRKWFLLLRIAAAVIQTRRRAINDGRRVRGFYLQLVNAAIIIQRRWRATVVGRSARQAFLQQRDLMIRLQAQIRSNLIRQAYIEIRWAATVIQGRLRQRNETRRLHHQFMMQRWAAAVIQMQWRAVVARRHVQHKYHMLRWAAIKIQSIARGQVVRQRYNELRNATLVVQRRRRAFVEGRAQEVAFLRVRVAVRVIQERWRAVLLGRATRAQYQEVRSSIIHIQATARGCLLRQRLMRVMLENQACLAIQAAWRGYAQRRAYLEVRVAAIKIQQTWKAVQQRHIDQHAFKEYQWGAAVIQQWWRACKAGRDVRIRYQRLRQAAITIQSVYRGQVARREGMVLRTIVGVQTTVRARYMRYQFERLRAAAVVIQQRWRAYRSGIEHRAMFESARYASIIIQRRWRAALEGRKVQQEYQSTRALIIAIQAHAMGALVRRAYQKMRWAATVVQERRRAHVQGREQRKAYLELWMASRKIQTAWRSFQLTKRQRHAYLDLRWASIVIQQRWRYIMYIRTMQMQAEAERQATAIMIQTAVRGCLVRNRVREYLEDRERVMVRWVELSSLTLSAICIQRCWRRYQDGKLAVLRETATVMIQRWWRQHLEAKQVHELELLAFRIQTQVRGFVARQRFYQQRLAIVKLQAWWRGHLVRQDCTAKIKAARKRIEHANATAEEHMKLGNRTTMALDILLSSGQLSAVLKACYHLDVVTRLSKNSCLRLVEHNVINIIFQLIKSCNRSQPHMEVLKHGLNIIENLSRDPDTVASVFWAPEGMEILVDCAQAYRENEMVFESVMTILLIHLEQDEKRRSVMKGMGPEVKKLRGVLVVMERKVEREGRSKSLHMVPGKPVRLLVQSVGKLRRIIELLQ
ncbi:hypothetical protein BC939DRAFT_204649 [Gamsiella multidivaricata]|uniref:uncharacterized protein n=1 Tax=Gamsiella multidivaricata TaxID=101098 RepID=UPI00221EB86A|nr:uncharacterized protein BC939DRAFT_204649 [Gamsiella multidivaricata]KAI7821532.1 hypothetical protein BC939DRAFT_204649 [Gamsiella multidivaricata]